MNPPEILEALLSYVREGRPVASVTIVSSTGSIPNAVGARMIVSDAGELLAGTVGGGEVEREGLKVAAAAIAEGKHRAETYRLTEKHAHGIGMMCGGSAQLFIEVFAPATRLVLVGGGHVNIEVYRLARHLGISAVVVDDRPEWANASHYPGAELVLATPKVGLAGLTLSPNDYMLIATAESDTESLRAAIDAPCRYVGLVASKRKTIQILRNLQSEGLDLSGLLPRLRAPVGLDLGGKSPEAIALSILAEIQAHRNGRDARPLNFVDRFTPADAAKEATVPS